MPLTPKAHIVGPAHERTRNIVTLEDGQRAYVRCGADILLTGLYQDITGEASCPVCGNKVRVAVEDGRVTSVAPQSARLHYVAENGSKFSICCDPTLIFDKDECLKTWLESYHGRPGKISSLSEFASEAISRRRPS